MICDPRTDDHQLKVGNDMIDCVDTFNFLGSLIHKEGGSSIEIKRRLAMARTSANTLSTIWKDRGISKATKIRIMNALVFPVATYGAETWAVGVADTKKISAFEMWCWRKLLGISWKDHKTNDFVRSQIGTKTSLCDNVRNSKLRYFGHIDRRNGDNIEKVLIQGSIQGTRKRGRPKLRWTDGIKEMTGLSLNTAHRLSQNRDRWRSIIIMGSQGISHDS